MYIHIYNRSVINVFFSNSVFLGYASTTEARVPCYMPTSQMTAYYFKEDRSWAIQLGWIEGNPICDEVQLLEETEGSHVFQETATRHCEYNIYCVWKVVQHRYHHKNTTVLVQGHTAT